MNMEAVIGFLIVLFYVIVEQAVSKLCHIFLHGNDSGRLECSKEVPATPDTQQELAGELLETMVCQETKN